MKESKPLNILYKKSINKIEAELLKIRKQFSSSPCQPDAIQILRWVLLACICIDINTPNDRVGGFVYWYVTIILHVVKKHNINTKLVLQIVLIYNQEKIMTTAIVL